jgi:4-hydroxybenzoyl-CoA reductase subunit alpha
MGLGEALFEDIKFDGRGASRTRRWENTAYQPASICRMWRPSSLRAYEPTSFRAKEVGEGAIMPTIPAILNAVYDATGGE